MFALLFKGWKMHEIHRVQCFDTVRWSSGRAPGLQKLSDEVLVWLSFSSEVPIVCIWSS